VASGRMAGWEDDRIWYVWQWVCLCQTRRMLPSTLYTVRLCRGTMSHCHGPTAAQRLQFTGSHSGVSTLHVWNSARSGSTSIVCLHHPSKGQLICIGDTTGLLLFFRRFAWLNVVLLLLLL
jgi:hypothetical protein